MRITEILERSKSAGNVIIVGAGVRGRVLFNGMKKDKDIHIAAIFDNNPELIGSTLENVEISKPYKWTEGSCVYIVALDNEIHRNELREQLQKLGVKDEDILEYYLYWTYEYNKNANEQEYEAISQERYFAKFGKLINWENPITFNEKMNWNMLHNKDPRRTRLADKLLAREWVKEKVGEEHLTKIYGVWNDAYDIDFESLPNAFVLKTNNGSGRNIIVKNKSELDIEAVCKQLNEWRDRNYAFGHMEMHYKDIVPRIFCEEYLEGVAEEVYDYNIYCFHGEPEYIWCIKGSHRPGCQASFYTKEWDMQEFSYGYPKDPIEAPRPSKLDEMLKLSRILCGEFEHVRVDWYNLPDGRVLFCEMTFTTWGGLAYWEPEEYDEVFGKLI